jgi:threonine/homoserine efflux transporter RhtA
MSEFEIQITAMVVMILIFVVPIGISRLIARRFGKIHLPWLFLLFPSIAAILPITMLALNQGSDPYGAVAIIGVAIIAFVIGLVLSGITYSMSKK